MKKLCLKLCQSQPASGHSPAGNARVPMTDEEKLRQRNRLLKTPASVKEHASSLAARWITDQLAAYGFDPFDGPFSEKEMKGDAILIICTESYRAIFDGEWRWLHIFADASPREVGNPLFWENRSCFPKMEVRSM